MFSQPDWITTDPNASFVGRESELRSLARHYSSGSRLAWIHGSAGFGKTSLARVFMRRFESLFAGGASYVNATSLTSQHALMMTLWSVRRTGRTLLVLDDVERFESPAHVVAEALQAFPEVSILAVSRAEPSAAMDALTIHLGGFSWQDFALWSEIYVEAGKANLLGLFQATSGNPGLAHIAALAVRNGELDWTSIDSAFKDIDLRNPLFTEGRSQDAGLLVPPSIAHDLRIVDDNLLARIARNPEAMRELPPRKFEELVADILVELGYHIDLTPPTRDGGFDMFAAKRSDVGQFLYLVECKRYTPPKKVGVGVIRSLYGVVQKESATAGLVVTSSFFTRDAQDFQQEREFQLHLSDFLTLKKWLSDIAL